MTALEKPEPPAFLRTRDFGEATDLAVFTLLPAAAINGGVAGQSECCGLPSPSDMRFVWLSGHDLVQVSVTGANLTVPEAQRIALRAGPS